VVTTGSEVRYAVVLSRLHTRSSLLPILFLPMYVSVQDVCKRRYDTPDKQARVSEQYCFAGYLCSFPQRGDFTSPI